MSRISRLLQLFLYGLDAFLNICAMVDMYMAEHIITWFYTACKILFVIIAALFVVLQVPLSYLFSHFRIKVSFVVEEVQSFIHIYNYMEQKLNTAS